MYASNTGTNVPHIDLEAILRLSLPSKFMKTPKLYGAK